MAWNWQQPDWPEFRWDAARLDGAEEAFLVGAGRLLGSSDHIGPADRDALAIEFFTDEALTTSEIEGELLNRESVQSSIQRELGLAAEYRRATPAEQGIAELMVNLLQTAQAPLDEATLFAWHEMLVRGRRDLHVVGGYREHAEPMQVVSGPLDTPVVHFEAPPSSRMPSEMRRFVDWFNTTAPGGPRPLPPLTRAGVAHLYFVSIHPFEDGNGRIGRAIAEKALLQGSKQSTLTALSPTILARRREYYQALERSSKSNTITEWLAWFAGIALEAQRRTQAQIQFILEKAKLLQRLHGRLNPRQEKALLRMFREGPQGFKGGLSAGNYVTITKTSTATATRDLADLVEKGALRRTGEKKSARYHLTIPVAPSRRVTIGKDGSVNIESP